MTHALKQTIKRLIDTSPPAAKYARKINRWIRQPIDRRLSQRALDRLRVRHRRFNKAFKTGVWSSTGESVSGSGSSLAATEKLRTSLPGALNKLEVKRLLDIPCGDWNWMRQVDLPVESYIGGDIVAKLICQNQERFDDPKLSFILVDLCVDKLPAADLLLCRDALIHFSIDDIWRVIKNVKKSNIRYFATTTFPATTVNTDQPTGVPWRHINLEADPFCFPAPLMTLVDDFNRSDQILGFWRVSDLPEMRRI